MAYERESTISIASFHPGRFSQWFALEREERRKKKKSKRDKDLGTRLYKSLHDMIWLYCVNIFNHIEYLLVQWEEDGEQHSVVDGKVAELQEGWNYKEGAKVVCRLKGGEYAATIVTAGTVGLALDYTRLLPNAYIGDHDYFKLYV